MNKDTLMKNGINYEEGIHRFCDNSAMYEKYLKKLLEITLIDELHSAVEENRLPDAFQICHKLKAFIGNLSIPTLYDAICRLTETLRAKPVNEEMVEKQLAYMETLYKQIVSVISKEVAHE